MFKTKSAAALALFLVVPAFAQAATVFNDLGYRKVAPGQVQVARELVRKYVLPTQQARVDAGEIQGWSSYSVRYPAGGDYDTISVTVSSNYAVFGSSEAFRDAFDKVHGENGWDGFIAQIEPLSMFVRNELWQQTRTVGSAGPQPYIRVNTSRTANPGAQQELETLLTDYATPFWTERLKDSGTSWSTYTLHLPGAGAKGHNNANAVGFADFAGTAPRTDFGAVFARAHPTLDAAEIGARFQSATSPVRSELWELEMATQ